MNAHEALQALLDGKVLREMLNIPYYRLIRLNDDGDIETMTQGNVEIHHTMPYVTFENVEIWVPYTLNFARALERLIQGKSVQSEISKATYFLYGGILYATRAETDDEVRGITAEEVKGMWRLVE